jgi:hypothetical protein
MAFTPAKPKLQVITDLKPADEPDMGDLIPWATELPKLREEDIATLDREACMEWRGRLNTEIRPWKPRGRNMRGDAGSPRPN